VRRHSYSLCLCCVGPPAFYHCNLLHRPSVRPQHVSLWPAYPLLSLSLRGATHQRVSRRSRRCEAAAVRLAQKPKLGHSQSFRRWCSFERRNSRNTGAPGAGDRFRKARQKMQGHLARWQENGRRVHLTLHRNLSWIQAARPKGSPERKLVSRSVFDVINMLKRNMVARAAVDMIDGDLSMVALRKCDVVIRLR
jgi:hypothetical protein